MTDYRVERLAVLHEQTTDRRSHRAYLEELLRLYEAGQQDTHWPNEASEAKVSARVREALEDDVESAYGERSGFGRYRALRSDALRAAYDGARTKARQADSLESLLPVTSSP